VTSPTVVVTPPTQEAWTSIQSLFPSATYASAWERSTESSWLLPLANRNNHNNENDTGEEQALDTASRHVIDRLQGLLRTGIVTDETPIVTRAWCHMILQQLGGGEDCSSNSRSNSHSNSRRHKSVSVASTLRAAALLQTMQSLEGLPAHGLPYILPTPNGRTFRLVLELYTHTTQQPSDAAPNDLHLAQQARALVHQMEDDYRTAAALDRKPTVVDWNMVLQTYANAQHDERALHAAHVLQHDMSGGSSSHTSSSSSSSSSHSLVDASSLLFVLRACAYRIPSDQAGSLGARVAAQLWHDWLATKHPEPTSSGSPEAANPHHLSLASSLSAYFYSLFLQAIRRLPHSVERETLFEAAFLHARAHGKINAVVVQEFLMHAKPLALVQEVLGAERMVAVQGLAPKQAAQQILMLLPAEWKAHAEQRSSTRESPRPIVGDN
jgi:hypothetical protein